MQHDQPTDTCRVFQAAACDPYNQPPTEVFFAAPGRTLFTETCAQQKERPLGGSLGWGALLHADHKGMLCEMSFRPLPMLALLTYPCSCQMLTANSTWPNPDHHVMHLAGHDMRQTQRPPLAYAPLRATVRRHVPAPRPHDPSHKRFQLHTLPCAPVQALRHTHDKAYHVPLPRASTCCRALLHLSTVRAAAAAAAATVTVCVSAGLPLAGALASPAAVLAAAVAAAAAAAPAATAAAPGPGPGGPGAAAVCISASPVSTHGIAA